MAKTTKDLQATWWEWLSMSERLLTALHRQTVALTLRKVEKIEEIQTDLDDLMDKMQELDDKAAALARGLAEELGVEPSLRSLVNVLEKAEAQQVQALANRVVVVGRNLQAVIDKNQALIASELDFINGTAAILVREAQAQTPGYGPAKSNSRSLAMDQAA